MNPSLDYLIEKEMGALSLTTVWLEWGLYIPHLFPAFILLMFTDSTINLKYGGKKLSGVEASKVYCTEHCLEVLC